MFSPALCGTGLLRNFYSQLNINFIELFFLIWVIDVKIFCLFINQMNRFSTLFFYLATFCNMVIENSLIQKSNLLKYSIILLEDKMFNKLVRIKRLVILFVFVSFLPSFNMLAQDVKEKTVITKNKNIQAEQIKQNREYRGIFTLLNKRKNFLGSPFSLEFSQESSSLYLGWPDYRKYNFNFVNSYHSFVVNLKLPLFIGK